MVQVRHHSGQQLHNLCSDDPQGSFISWRYHHRPGDLVLPVQGVQEIKALAEWTTHILFLESTVASTPGYTPDTLFNETQAKYTTLLNQGLWRPSDKTLEEQILPWLLNSSKSRKVPKIQQSLSPTPGRVSK